jgi:phospholipid/cholesterol/gamma-HCH transport system substrate-binding protein
MTRKTSKFMIGLFVTTGILLGAVAVIWIGASTYYQKGKLYVTYFDESVQGLQMDSRVKYRGVDVGKVEAIRVAPDGHLVEVLMKIDMEGEIQRNSFAQLRVAGLTGLVFIELDHRPWESPLITPKITFPAKHPIIPSQLSQARQMLTSVDKIMGKMEEVDIQGLADQIRRSTGAAEAVLAGDGMKRILANIESATASLDRTIRRADSVLAQVKIDGVLAETKEGVQEARRLMVLLQEQLKGLKLAETVEKSDRLVEGVDRRTRRVASEVEAAADEIREAALSLRLLVERLEDNPSELLFSKPRDEAGEGAR